MIKRTLSYLSHRAILQLLVKVYYGPYIVKAMVFPVVMYGSENWTIKKAECRRIDGFELWCDCKEIQQSILKEISPGISLEGMMLKLKLQYFGHLIGGTDSFEKTLILGKIEGGRRG